MYEILFGRDQNDGERRCKAEKTAETDALAADLGRLLNIWVGLK